MRRKISKFSDYDGSELLTNEELIRMCIAEVRKMGIEECTASAIEDGKRACARYGLSLAAAGLAEEGAAPVAGRLPQESLTLPAASLILAK